MPDAERFLPMHPLEFRVLLSLLDGPSYGSRIVEDVEAREGGGRPLYPANLYRRIRGLLADGLIAETEAPEGADPRRTYVRLTDLGHRVASAETRRLRALVADTASHDLLREV